EEEAERIKREFVSMVGHELRTPLTLIRATIDLLYEGDAGALNETQERVVTILRNNSERLLTLISDLLDMSAIDSGRMRIQPDTVALTEVIGAVVEELRPAATAKQHEITLTAPASLTAWIDRPRVQQVVSNLLGNAIKYTPPGGHLRVTITEGYPLAEVSIEDDGIGITAEEQVHLFEKFYRAPQGQRTSGGTGLGLAIARSLVELHGGSIRCESDG